MVVSVGAWSSNKPGSVARMSDKPKVSTWAKIETAEAAAVAIRKLDRLGRSVAESEARRRYLDVLDPQPGEYILDVGGGSGLATLEIARRVSPSGKAVALDPSPPLLDYARGEAAASGLGDNTEFEVGDGRALPFPDGSFDRAFCHWVLVHVTPPEGVVREMRRVVRSGGRIVCVELDREAPILFPGAPELSRRIFDFCAARHPEEQMGRRLPGIVRSCGLADVQVEALVLLDEGSRGDQWLEFLRGRAELALGGKVISEAEATAWTGEIEAAAREGRYLLAVMQFVVRGTVP
jgi:ubiquinone/menaquinone biosynthesis C-methylase UbiE